MVCIDINGFELPVFGHTLRLGEIPVGTDELASYENGYGAAFIRKNHVGGGAAFLLGWKRR